ncbi:hypothetical protein PHMEG_00024860 [Phytophthora megakarya]|uniref:Uncharacterized protein n=1 Tax=Phytophthora megakarya TaxID=4795 RepID=A0A225VCJ8_9STRA|nr:hypothetical protein PHMEG_00024860 [Phytophthora megakarya]
MTSSLHVTNCRFLRLSCRSDEHELFSSSYARSNKNRNTKLLRCFPHCCPDHAPRSYCGCSLHVLLTFATADEAAAVYENDNVVVCARFEAATGVAVSSVGGIVTAMPTDSIVALPSSALVETAAVDNDWVRAEKAADKYQQAFPKGFKDSILYVLNNHRSPHWYYGYDSGSTKSHREMKHVLAVYTFVLHPPSTRTSFNQTDHRVITVAKPKTRMTTVVARHTSPSFTMISYRRHTAIKRTEREYLETATGVPSVAPVETKTSEAEVNTLVDDAVMSQSSDSSEITPATDVSATSTMSPLQCPICKETLGVSSHILHRTTVEQLQPLVLLHRFMRFVPLDTFAFYFGPMDFRIQRRWLAKIAPTNPINAIVDATVDAAAQAAVADIASAFSLKNFLTGQPPPETIAVVMDLTREQVVLRSCADLLLDVFSSLRVRQILMSAFDTRPSARESARAYPVSMMESCSKFSEVVADLSKEFSQLLTTRNIHNASFGDTFPDGRTDGPASIPELVDEILSLVYAESKYLPLRQDVSALFLRKYDALDVAVQDIFRAFVAEQQASGIFSRTDLKRETLPLQPDGLVGHGRRVGNNQMKIQNADWTRRWFLVPTSVFITPLMFEVGDASASPSLLVAVALLRMFASIDVRKEGSTLYTSAAMVETTLPSPPLSSTVLRLDGQSHTFSSLPNGLLITSASLLFGDGWGMSEYEGCVADDGSSLDVVMVGVSGAKTPDQPDLGQMSLTSRDTTLVARRIHFRLALEDAGVNGGYCLSVSAEVSVADGLPPRFDSTMASVWNNSALDMPAAKWTPTLEVVATYISVS